MTVFKFKLFLYKKDRKKNKHYKIKNVLYKSTHFSAKIKFFLLKIKNNYRQPAISQRMSSRDNSQSKSEILLR
ncbi:MAG: hypothetical protein EA361_17905 [Bacteroidetes bacterium]|nr:MAG: hypothetical protein EA361_17905 [Bacteroidota bacterium]